jgi:hypothetical protein
MMKMEKARSPRHHHGEMRRADGRSKRESTSIPGYEKMKKMKMKR